MRIIDAKIDAKAIEEEKKKSGGFKSIFAEKNYN